MVGVTQIGPGFVEEATEEAGPGCQRLEVGVHAATFSVVASVTGFCEGAGSLRGETGVVSALG